MQAQCGKVVIAVSDDIEPNNADAIFWSIAYRSNITTDVVTTPYRSGGHGPKSAGAGADGTLMIDATLKGSMPPLALPAEVYMTRARKIWEDLQMPRLMPQSPWHGYELGDWDQSWTTFAERAVSGDWEANGEETARRQRDGMKPETPVRDIERQGK